MNGRESKITRFVFSNDEYKDLILEKLRKNESIIGTKIIVRNKKYVITYGGLENVLESIKEFKRRIKNKFLNS